MTTLEYREEILIHKVSEDNYKTNTGCKIIIYREDGLRKLYIYKENTFITYDEIKTIRYRLLNRNRNFYMDIDTYGDSIILVEVKNKVEYKGFGSEIITEEVVKSYDKSQDLNVLVTLDGEVELHLSASSTKEEYISLLDMLSLRMKLLPKDKKFGMFFPPEEEFVNIHKNCFHLIEITQ